MSIVVAEDVARRIEMCPGGFTIQVRDASDPAAALAGLAEALNEIYRLRGGPPRYSSGVTSSRPGPFFYMDAEGMPMSALLTIPQVVARHLAAAGVESATIAAPRGGDEWGMALSETPRAVVLALWPRPPRRLDRRCAIPSEWFDEVVAWTRSGLGDDDRLGAAMASMQYYISARDGVAHLRDGYASAPPTCHLFAGDFRDRIRAVNGRFWNASLVVAGGGPTATDADLIAIFEELRDMARGLAPAAQANAFVSFDPDFAAAVNVDYCTERSRDHGVRESDIHYLWDQVLLDAFPYQILCPGHVARLGGPPPGSREIGEGLVELSIGSPRSWLLDPDARELGPAGVPIRCYARRDPSVQAHARELLAPCLVDGPTARQLFSDRFFGSGS